MTEPRPDAQGDLNRFPIPRLLFFLLKKAFVGEVEIAAGPNLRGRLYFRDGLPVFAALPSSRDVLGRILLERGLISEDVYHRSLQELSSSKQLHGQILIGMGALDQRGLVEGLRLQLYRKLNRLFPLTQATISIFGGEHSHGLDGEEAQLQADSLRVIYHGVRNCFDAARLKPELDKLRGHVIQVRPGFERRQARYAMGEEEQALTTLLSRSAMTLAQLLRISNLGQLETLMLVYTLWVTEALIATHTTSARDSAELAAAVPAEAPLIVPPPLRPAPPPPSAQAAPAPPPRPRSETVPEVEALAMAFSGEIPLAPIDEAEQAEDPSAAIGLDVTGPSLPPLGSGPLVTPPPPGLGSGPLVTPPPPGLEAGPLVTPPPPGLGAGPLVTPPPPGLGATPLVTPPPPDLGVAPLILPPPDLGVAPLILPAPDLGVAPLILPPPEVGGSPIAPPADELAASFLSSELPPIAIPAGPESSLQAIVEGRVEAPPLPAAGGSTTGSHPAVGRGLRPNRPSAQVAASVTPQQMMEHKQLVKTAFEGIKEKNHFQVLELARAATTEAVRDQYFKLAKVFHPDRCAVMGAPEMRAAAEEVFRRINEAHTVLTNPEARKAYEEELDGSGDKKEVQNALEAEFVFQKGVIFFRKKNYAEALQHFEEAFRLNPKEGEHQAWIAWTLFHDPKQKREQALPKAKDLLLKAIKSAPQNPTCHYYLGEIYLALGDEKRAKTCFNRTIECQEGHVEANRHLRLMAMRKEKEQKKTGLFGKITGKKK